MRTLIPTVLGAALILGCAAAGAAQPRSASVQNQNDQDHGRPTQAYSAGYSQGQADVRNSSARNDQPPAQWTSVEDQRAWRQGYEAGFNSGTSRAEQSASSPVEDLRRGPQQATDYGYQDGLADGRHDRTKDQKFRPEDSRFYKAADHGWTAALGTKGEYQRLYREAYMRGYEEGFRGTGSQ